MSTSVDHQHHGQLHQNSSNAAEQVVASVCEEQWTDPEFPLRQTQQNECQLVLGSASVNDTCIPGFYAPSISVGDTHSQPMAENILWTATEPVIYVGGYDMSGSCISGSPVFRSVDYPQHFSYGWFPGVDYSEWNTGGVMVGGNQGYAESYYLVEGVGMENCMTINGDQMMDVDVKALQQSLDGMRLEDGHCQFGYTMSSMPSAGVSSFSQNGASWMLTANQYSHPNKAHRAPQNGLESGSWSAQFMWDGALHSHNSLPLQRGSTSAGTAPAKLSFGSAVHPTYATADGSQSVLNFDLLHGSSGNLPNFGQYNPTEFSLSLENARFFIIKSYSEDDVHRSIKYGIWCSTEYGNKRLDAAYQECNGLGSVYLLFSVNGSGHFCGVAEMTSPVDYAATSSIWAQNKWKGQFDVRWIYVKDVPNSQLRHIKLENNENKPVTNSRDTQEVLCEKGKQVVRIIHQYHHTTSIFDDYSHYEQRQEDERKNKENYRK